jgi:hypothetical protein
MHVVKSPANAARLQQVTRMKKSAGRAPAAAGKVKRPSQRPTTTNACKESQSISQLMRVRRAKVFVN